MKKTDMPKGRYSRCILSVCTVILVVILPAYSHGNSFSHGDPCSVQGAWHQINDSTGVEILVCDSLNWRLALKFDASGNSIELDNDPATGSSGCIRYNGSSSVLEFSNDCNNFSAFSSLWRNDGPEGVLGEIYYNAGNVGINRTNPAYTLDVDGSIRTEVLRSAANPTETYITQGSGSNITNIFVGGVRYAHFNGASHVTDIGTTSATDPATIRIGFDSLLYIDNANQRIGIRNSSPDAELDVNGDIHYTGILVDVSDRNLKENIHSLTDETQRIMNLTPVSYVMKEDPDQITEYGFIANDVERVYPELVFESGQGKSLNYMGLIAPLTQVIQEKHYENKRLQEENERIKRLVSDLESRLEILEGTSGKQ